MARRKSKLNSEECKQSIVNFFQKQKKFKKIQTQFGEIKTEFYNDMEDYFKCNDVDGKLTIECDKFDGVESFVVTRIQSSKVEFNANKLEKVLGKEKVDFTIGSALDLFGGKLEFEKIVKI